jgi:N-acetylmuramoyl-L-alanine amidase
MSVAQQTKVTVIIDAGHGGSDPGHLSEGKKPIQEKDINLKIAQKLGAYLSEKLQNIEVIYTRTDDSFVSLDERVAIANSKNADYFISIHCNANASKRIRGTESHVHDFSFKKSVSLAKEFEKEFSKRAGRNSRGIKDNNDREHSLQVLKQTKMTSVLVECGFLTNETELNFLISENGQDVLASALFRGLRTHISTHFPTITILKTDKKEDPKNTSDSSLKKYYVQITSSKEEIDTNHESFKRTGETVQREKLNTTSAYKYRYLIGGFSDKDEAKKIAEKVKTKGFPDAIIIQK